MELAYNEGMSDPITDLLKLQALDFKEITEPNSESVRTDLRKSIPQPILAHYDRLVARGKKGVAIVRNQVCTGCHMRLPIGTINTLLQRNDIQLCDSCGRYLYIPEQTEGPVAQAAPAPQTKPAPKPRKRKTLAQTSA
jgi:predicted  nucleic acid-binding Zn-ribbon protein